MAQAIVMSRAVLACMGLAALLWGGGSALAEDDPWIAGLAALSAARWEEAEKQAEQILKSEPRSARGLELKGRAELGRGRPDDAARLIYDAIQADPNRAELHYWLGETAFAQKLWPEALGCYARYLRESKGADVRNGLLKIVYCHTAMGNLAEAGRLAAKFDPFDKEHPGYYFARGAVLRASGRKEDAEKNLQQGQTLYGVPLFGRYLVDYLFLFKAMEEREASSGPAATR